MCLLTAFPQKSVGAYNVTGGFRILIVYFYCMLHWNGTADLHCTLQGTCAGEAAGLEHEAGPIGDRLLGDDW